MCHPFSSNNVPNREFYERLGQAIRLAKTGMKPVLKGWLLETHDRNDELEFATLRELYLPETLIAYVSALQYAGSSLTRDNLLEAMDLAAVVAERNSDIAALLVKTGRMKELVLAFASVSKALAAEPAEKKKAIKTGQTSIKKMREMGWSKELWNVRDIS